MFSLAIGIFYGIIAVSLAEVLNVLPIIHRRFNLNKGLQYFLLSLALGKHLDQYYIIQYSDFIESRNVSMTKIVSNNEYSKMVQKASPNSPIITNCIKAFL